MAVPEVWFMFVCRKNTPVSRENKKIKPATRTTFATNDFAFIDYSWLAPAPVRQRRQSSIDTYGSFEKEITLTDIQTIADAEARTAQILDRFSTPFLVGEILVKSVSTISLDVGDTVTIVDNLSKPNINQNFIITKQVIKYPGSNQELTIGDESLRMKDWQFNVEERLKRLEEQFLKNQDILQELFDFENTLIIQPRYRRIFTETVGGTNLFILGNTTYGLLGTGKLGDTDLGAEIDSFIQQFENSYTEDFIDTDFFDDPNSTGDWLTGVITSGQTLRSLSIDFDNSTISVATATFTESGAGTPTFYLSADGGSNWEIVTSGVAHTFSNTGTSLKWRIDSAGDTTTVTKVVIGSYH
ncbi:MAG: hypothetical protein IIC67_09595 [Thaumarchaeota archaeon]|nr:hypothetical protein [Nitrososphaerota archaeon]